MNPALKRLLSFTFALILAFSVFVIPAAAQSVSFDQIVHAATYIIINNEGNYTTVVRKDVNAISIGELGWHATNALNLLKDIIAKNPTQALHILGSSLYNEIVTSSSWEGRVATYQEANVISILLATTESREVQDATAYTYISGYVRHGQSLGITEPRALVFFADFENQNGRYGAYSFYTEVRNLYGTVNLSTLYRASSQNSRRTRTYNFCLNVNFDDFINGFTPERDTKAPEINDVTVSNLTSSGYTVSCKTTDNVGVTDIYFAVYHKNDGTEGAKWYQVTPSENGVSHTVDIAEFSNRAGDYYTYIYAFDKAGNYAYVELNVITVPKEEITEPQLTLTVSVTGEIKKGEKIRWKAATANGSGNYAYTFKLYRDDTLVKDRRENDLSELEFEAAKTGVYRIEAAVKDKDTGKTAKVTSVTNVFEPIEPISLTPTQTAAILGQTIEWDISVTGGEGELKYSYTVYKDGEAVHSTGFGSNTHVFYRPTSGGVYSITATVTDERNQTASIKSDTNITVIEPLSVSDVAFSKSYAVKDQVISCSAVIRGGATEHAVVFEILCDGETILSSEPADTDTFVFEVPCGGNYTAKVTVTDKDSTTTSATGGSLTADERAKTGDADCNGVINAADARYTLRCAARLDVIQEKLQYAGDANKDGFITAADARIILRVAAKLETIEE